MRLGVHTGIPRRQTLPRKAKPRGLLFIPVLCTDKQQKNTLRGVLVIHHYTTAELLSVNVGVPAYAGQKNKFLPVRRNVACANRYLGYLAYG